MTLLYILIGLFVVYLAYSYGSKKGNGQVSNTMHDDNNTNSHMQPENKKRKGGCC